MALRKRSDVLLVLFIIGLAWTGHSVNAKPWNTENCDSYGCSEIRVPVENESSGALIATITGVCIVGALIVICTLCCLCCKACCCSPTPPTTIVYQMMAEPRAGVTVGQIPLDSSSVPSISTHSIVTPPPSYEKSTHGVHM